MIFLVSLMCLSEVSYGFIFNSFCTCCRTHFSYQLKLLQLLRAQSKLVAPPAQQLLFCPRVSQMCRKVCLKHLDSKQCQQGGQHCILGAATNGGEKCAWTGRRDSGRMLFGGGRWYGADQIPNLSQTCWLYMGLLGLAPAN